MEFRNRSLITPGSVQSAAGPAVGPQFCEPYPAGIAASAGPQFSPPYPAAVATAEAVGVQNSAAVLGQQFCLPYPVQLTVSKKAHCVTDCDLTVTDVNGVVIFKVREELLTLRDRRVLLDGIGNPVVTMKKKLWTTHERWRVFRGESSEESDFVFSVKKASGLRVKFDVFLAANINEEPCDFRIKGNFFDRECTIYRGTTNSIIAQVSREHTGANATRGKEAFGVTVHPNFDYAFVVALVVVLEGIYRWEENSDD
ncbi:protein LURP-one-related 10-like [Typha latifolia]|uniref:protein LURP-one-related 10-like n=1 Tax=Typha latifolia TaxID=4733 RepID=UPI003C2FFC34